MATLGIDCGSVSVKFALIAGDELVGKVYLKNQGLISTVQEGLRQLPRANISGVGITGSGKDFVKALVGADYTDSEIMAHAIAAQHYYPNVQTILDIGGEDSKLIILRKHILSDFQMNRDCGGGTGSMIETIANRLGVKIEDAGDIALESKNPATLPGKCGIFCQSAAISQMSKGRPTQDILMGVSRALVGNYLATLAKGKKLLPPVVFQGATAQNRALVECFQRELGCPVSVPNEAPFMGAIGIALLAEEHMNGQHTRFRGEAVLDTRYRTEIKHCKGIDGCPCGEAGCNCELLYLYYGDKVLAVSGSRCGRLNR